jgi:cold shock protein
VRTAGAVASIVIGFSWGGWMTASTGTEKGYGFIQPQNGGKDVFVHISAVEKAGLTGLNEGQVVEYEEVPTKGKTSGEHVCRTAAQKSIRRTGA